MGKMGLRLRKDVQKASYYVWFLGAQEARGLRGSRILLPVIPRLIERSHEQEPLKVTLQVSHKGLKIIQGSSKHFIPHSAITCSVQTDDIVACVLLLYNPATRCPLHVHAYRCDSQTTAQALNQQLQILINRPENQKRFNELETRLGLPAQDAPLVEEIPVKQKSTQPPATTTTTQSHSKQQVSSSSRRFESPARRFDSSLGSDTGTSTRESECSEEHTPTSPIIMPLSGTPPKANLYDSLAAELRAKLSGNGPPLLLPPRDYDTVHRSKGNLAAIELRRCRNISIVGGPQKTKTGISSRGSSGIGSDLAPSPERQEGQTSSDDDWGIEHNLHQDVSSPSRRTTAAPADDPVISPSTKYTKNKTPAYIYPREKIREDKFTPELQKENIRYKQRSSSREEDKSQDSINSSREEEVKPVLNKIRPSYREVFDDKKYMVDDEKRFIRYDDRKPTDDKTRESRRYSNNHEKYRDDGEPTTTLYRKHSADRSTKYMEPEVVEYRADNNYRENLTDKQKYRESLAEKRINQIKHQERTIDRKERYRDQSVERSTKYRENSVEKVIPRKYEEFDKNRYNREKSSDQIKYKPKEIDNDEERIQYRGGRNSSDGFHLNPYKQPENQPYRESVEKMMKSPIMRYKSVDDSRYPQNNENDWGRDNRDSRKDERKRYSSSTDRYRETSPMGDRYRDEPNPRYRDDRYQIEEIRTPPRKFVEVPPESMQTMSKVSPKDRFQDAKEKFQAMERERTRTQEKNKLVRKSSMEPSSRRGSLEPPITPVHHYPEKQNSHDGWSSDEEPVMRTRYREPEPTNRYSGLERQPSQSRIAPSKSLGNLVKGYRHSYAEPQRNPLPRGSGRVGLAAVNPY